MKKQLTLGEIMFLLSRIDPEASVRYDFGPFVPTAINSYRGYYGQLAIGFAEPCGGTVITVQQLLIKCRDCVETDFEGYKGGAFTMHESTYVWVANWGKCHDTAIVGIIDQQNEAIIETAYLP